VASEGTKFELYDYPGGYSKKYNKADSASKVQPEGETLNRAGVEREETFEISISGDSTCRALASGYKFDVKGGFAAGTYLLTELKWTVNQVPAYSNEPVNRPGYGNSFKAIPAATPFVPPALHGRNAVQGLQTALVIDESNSGNAEEIWPDKYGRVRVRFPWDRDAKYACWLRVIQPWAGAKWGQQWIPRVGDEVAVTFLEGDPDCPVVAGSLYNRANLPMFSLPDNKTQSGIQTHSSPGGGGSNYNMLRFEDKAGNEEIFIQAEKDWNSVIKHDETRKVQNNRTTTIHVDESRTVETGNDTIAVQQGKRTITVNKDISVTSDTGNISTTASLGDISTSAKAGQITVTALKNISEESQTGNISIKALMNISESSETGNISIQASVGQISISGLAGVTISCGASSISMTPASISISAPMVLINS
jgi:type VI secretion system secreted protein VgrG